MDCPTLHAWGLTWIERMRELVGQGILRSPTVAAYERVVRLHLGPLLETPLDALTRPALIAWANRQIAGGAARKSLVLRVAVLKVCLRDAISEGLIQMNPAERLISSLRLPRERTVKRWFDSTDQAGAFLATAEGGREWPALALMLYTGLRLGEALGLQWEDLDMDAQTAAVVRQVTQSGEVVEPKTASGSRTVDLPGALVDVLRHHRASQLERALRAGREPGPWVLGAAPAASYAARHRIRRALERALRDAGLPRLTPHGLRHSWLSFRAQMGQDSELIREQAGHSDKRTTRTYTHLQRSDPAAADAVADAIRPRQGRLFRRGRESS